MNAVMPTKTMMPRGSASSAPPPPAVRNQMASEHCRQEEDEPRRNRRRLKWRETEQPDPYAVKSRTDEAAEAPERVHSTHDAPPNALFHQYGDDVDHDVDATHHRTEDKYDRHGKRKCVHA